MAAVLTLLAATLRRAASALGEADGSLAFAVVGGLGVSVRTEPRFTRDVDLVVAVADDRSAEALVLTLSRAGYRPFAVFEHAVGRLSTVRLIPPGGEADGVLVDLLFASCGIEAEITAASQRLEVLPGVELPVARLGHLLAMKLLSAAPGRPNDSADLVALMAEADHEELQRCARALDLITQRGFHRGRDLRAALADLQRECGRA